MVHSFLEGQQAKFGGAHSFPEAQQAEFVARPAELAGFAYWVALTQGPVDSALIRGASWRPFARDWVLGPASGFERANCSLRQTARWRE